MDRHNMMLFLLQDTLRKDPVGFENRRRNIFVSEYLAPPLTDSNDRSSLQRREKAQAGFASRSSHRGSRTALKKKRRWPHTAGRVGPKIHRGCAPLARATRVK